VSYLELIIRPSAPQQAQTTERQTALLQALKEQKVTRREVQLPLRSLFFSFLPTGWKDTPLDGKHFRRATATSDPLTGLPVVQITFDREGGELFYELTKRNVGKPIAIFVGGQLISAPTVQSEIPGGVAVITGSRSFDEANQLAQNLNTGAIPAPIHLVGQVTVEPTLGAEALRQSLRAALIGLLLVGVYLVIFYRVLGLLASLALLCYAIVFTAILKLPLLLFTDEYIVLTLAGLAGIILSIGMAVDANVLIFERMREELAKGKLFRTAVDIGFQRAWPAIWDSNMSTLLTAMILFLIGTSIVRGFAVTLSMGILLSMFTALVATRSLLRLIERSPITGNLAAFGVKQAGASPRAADPERVERVEG
jgi:preprotein translocase subunit SecD